jgi:hypothetical protein
MASAATTKLVWSVGDPVIAQIGSYLMLSSGSKEGFVTGDRVTFYAPLGRGEAGELHAPVMAAETQVLRVTPFGASVVILNRTQATLTVGMQGRVTAKMP